MDSRLQVKEVQRPGVPAGLEEIPMVTLGWRFLREEKRRQLEASKHLQTGLAGVARQSFHLRRLGEKNHRPEVNEVLARLEQALGTLGITILVPTGEAFTADLTELFENIAQVTQAGLDQPHVLEVMEPAILYQGSLVEMGKAVIAVPIRRAVARNSEPERTQPAEGI